MNSSFIPLPSVLVTFFIAGTQYTTPITQGIRGLTWLMFQKFQSTIGRAKHGNGMVEGPGWSKAAHVMVLKKLREVGDTWKGDTSLQVIPLVTPSLNQDPSPSSKSAIALPWSKSPTSKQHGAFGGHFHINHNTIIKTLKTFYIKLLQWWDERR